MLEVIILAAGKGTRMVSSLPKVLHEVAGKPMLQHVLDTCHELGADRLHVVYGYGGDLLREKIQNDDVNWILQAEQNGTGHAVDIAMSHVSDESTIIVLYGDVPLISKESLNALLQACGEQSVALMTAFLQDGGSYGRILRDSNQCFQSIVEHRDATPEQCEINEINTGFLAAPAARLKSWVSKLECENAQGEFYLTDIFAMAVADGVPVETCQPVDNSEILGINDRQNLSEVERIYQQQQAKRYLQAGLTVCDPNRFDIRGSLKHGKDCSIDINVIIEGDVTLGDRVSVGPNTLLRNMTIGDDVEIKANCILEDSSIGELAIIGPFARIRPESEIASLAHIGNFVEIKKSQVGSGSKVNHLSYIGDTEIGADVNIGAGVITCNYDGANKFKTIIGDNAFIGSDSQLVAPVEIGKGATIGAGSTITQNAPDNELTLSRAEQKTRKGWQRPVKNKA
ncbi:MAG: bifunctional UDP-N-acetylglucosamine diphosphorylase/glucosamine-1-phosphate N-acetyltransferase GlmU [Arenicellales bacterium]|jgi:bifunctional UDP-N-acetylglucosamine pyrophosphorylase/glucosamine-1-phosphate N-acetyltransferase